MNPDGAVSRILAAFRHANLVALGERHWTREDSQFRLDLVRHSQFPRSARDILVEFAASACQETLDRFVDGEAVSAGELRKVWQATTQPGAWDSPVYEEFLYAVRQINAALPKPQRLRVLAGDPGAGSGTPLAQANWKDPRDRFAASVIEREILGRGRKALVIFGALHLYRNHVGTIVDHCRHIAGAKWFIVVPVSGPDLPAALSAAPASASAPALVRLNRGPAGRLAANQIFERGTLRVQFADGKPVLADGKPVLVPAQVFDPSLQARQVADACLWFGAALPQWVGPRPA